MSPMNSLLLHISQTVAPFYAICYLKRILVPDPLSRFSGGNGIEASPA